MYNCILLQFLSHFIGLYRRFFWLRQKLKYNRSVPPVNPFGDSFLLIFLDLHLSDSDLCYLSLSLSALYQLSVSSFSVQSQTDETEPKILRLFHDLNQIDIESVFISKNF